MESKFPIESDFGKYFLYELYLKTNADFSKENFENLKNATLFSQCLNINRRSLRSYNCGERKRKLDNYFIENKDDFNKFREKISENCSSQISNYLSIKFHNESTSLESNLFQKLNNEEMLKSNLKEVGKCLNIDLKDI
jgi:hypothetical protein